MDSESDLFSCIISITKKQATPSRAAEIDWFSLQIVSSKFCEMLLVYGTSLILGVWDYGVLSMYVSVAADLFGKLSSKIDVLLHRKMKLKIHLC